jgi:hypothetical protein
MTDKIWLNKDHQLLPGEEIFRSDRRFFLEAYSASHGQLLFRSICGNDGDNHHETTIDLLFKPTEAIKIQNDCRGLTIRCATTNEAERIKESLPGLDVDSGYRVFLLDSQGTTGYVISMAVGWQEGILHRTQRSFFNNADLYSPTWPTQPLFGVNNGLNEASVHDLIHALKTEDQARRDRFHMVYVLMTRIDLRDGPDISGAGVFLTEADAHDARAQLAPKVADCWIDILPIAL